MASTNCVVFSWHHQGRVECLFLELSASHNIHFLRVARGGRLAWGSVGTWHAFSTPNGPRLCLRSFSCCLGARLRELTFDVDPRGPRRMIDGTGRVLYYKGNLRMQCTELLLRCSVSHRIAQVSSSLVAYLQAPCLFSFTFLPVELCSGRPNCGATQSFGEKLTHYKAIRSQEMVLVRPFRDKEAVLRPYLRYFQWSQIWGSQEAPTEAILPDLQH